MEPIAASHSPEETPGPAAFRAGLRQGIREACGVPGIVLGASYLGFGSLVRESHLSFFQGMLSTATTWALPGQIAMAEMMGLGANLVLVALAVSLANVRLMPMVITLSPFLGTETRPRGWRYGAAHLVAATSWAVALRFCPRLPEGERRGFFLGLGGSLWVISLLATAVSFALTASLPRPVTLALVFLNPLYFVLLFIGDAERRLQRLALLCGGVLGPLAHSVSPDWGLMVAGVLGGSLAFGIERVLSRKTPASLARPADSQRDSADG